MTIIILTSSPENKGAEMAAHVYKKDSRDPVVGSGNGVTLWEASEKSYKEKKRKKDDVNDRKGRQSLDPNVMVEAVGWKMANLV